jgi:hypothetical protein
VKKTITDLETKRSRIDLWANFKEDSKGESKEPLRLKVKVRTILKTGRSAQRPFAEAKESGCVNMANSMA